MGWCIQNKMVQTEKEEVTPYFHKPVMLRNPQLFTACSRENNCGCNPWGGRRRNFKQDLPGGKLIGIDCDQEALNEAKKAAAYGFFYTCRPILALKEVVHGLSLEVWTAYFLIFRSPLFNWIAKNGVLLTGKMYF